MSVIPSPGSSNGHEETNDLGFVASLLFILVPAIFLIVLYIGTQNNEA